MQVYKLFKRGKDRKDEKSPVAVVDENKKASDLVLPPVSSDDSKALVISKPAEDSPSGVVKAPETPVLDKDDEEFLKRLATPSTGEGEGEGSKPPLPPRVKTPDLEWDEDTESFRRIQCSKDTANEAKAPKLKPAAKKASRLSIFLRKDKKKDKKKDPEQDQSHLTVPTDSVEVDREKDDITRVLDDLNLAARNNKAFSVSAESAELVRKFTVILKDLVNGVPTAGRDLISLLDGANDTLASNFEKLPGSFKKLVAQIPNKLTTTLAPELLAVAAEIQGISKEEAAAKGGLKGAAKNMFMPKNMADLVTKPGAVAGMLKAIVNALKVRWPAFIGTNVLWSVAVFLLLFVLWYCYKRGREERLEREKSEAEGKEVVDDAGETSAAAEEANVPAQSTLPEIEEPPASAPASASTPANPVSQTS